MDWSHNPAPDRWASATTSGRRRNRTPNPCGCALRSEQARFQTGAPSSCGDSRTRTGTPKGDPLSGRASGPPRLLSPIAGDRRIERPSLRMPWCSGPVAHHGRCPPEENSGIEPHALRHPRRSGPVAPHARCSPRSEWRDSNPRPPAPKAGARPAALHSEVHGGHDENRTRITWIDNPVHYPIVLRALGRREPDSNQPRPVLRTGALPDELSRRGACR